MEAQEGGPRSVVVFCDGRLCGESLAKYVHRSHPQHMVNLEEVKYHMGYAKGYTSLDHVCISNKLHMNCGL